MYRILLLCREGIRLCYEPLRWEYVWRWHTWTIEDTYQEASDELLKLRVHLNPMILKAKIIGVDDLY